MKWLKHDSDAFTDAKLKKLRLKYGMSGYGVYWYILELITSDIDDSNLSFELEEDSEIIANDTGINIEIIQEMMVFMVNLGLFDMSNNKIRCLKLAKRLDQSMVSNKIMREQLKKVKEFVPDKSLNLHEKDESHDKIMENHDSVMIQSGKPMQEKKRKEKKRKDTVKIAHLIPSDFQPSERCKELIQSKNIPMSFAVGLIPDFIFYWTEQSEKRKSWDTTFLNHVKSRFEYFQKDKKPFVSESEVFNYD